MAANLLHADHVRAARAAAEELRACVGRLPTVAVGKTPVQWRASTTRLHIRAAGVLHALRALRAAPAFGVFASSQPARELCSAADQVRSRSLPALLAEIGMLTDPTVRARERHATASRLHLTVELLQDDLDRLVEALDAVDPGAVGGDAGT